MSTRNSDAEAAIIRAFAERQRLRAVARRLGAKEEEDLIQDAFVRMVERSQTQDISKLDNLLRHVVRCFAIDRIRRKDVRRTFNVDGAGESAVDAAADPERRIMGTQRLRRVMAAIDAMPPRRREVFLLHRVDEMTYAQIARRLNVTIKAVEKHMHLAMRQLSDTDD